MSTIKSSSEDLTLDADGGSSEIKLKINNVEKASISSAGAFTSTTIDATALTGNLPAISGASLTGLPAAGDKRNFITDGDFTQWIGATSATAVTHRSYTNHALTQYRGSNDGTSTVERSTDTPTVAESSHESKYSLLMKCTGTDASITTNQGNRLYHYITGTNYSSLHRQEFTISFWAKTAGANSGDTYYLALQNSTDDESYVKSFTATSSWAKYTFTIPASNAGTWLFTEDDVGLKVIIVLAAGDTNDDGTDGSWVSTGEYWDAGTAISNFMDSTSNEFYLSQLQLTLGSEAPTFTSPPIATVQDQVQYYVEAFNFDQEGTAQIHLGTGCYVSTTQLRTHIPFNTRKRATPSMTNSSTADDFSIQYGASGCNVVTINGWIHANTVSAVYMTTQTPTVTGGEAGQVRIRVSGAWILADARH
jgi:hypothetical protein